MEQATGSTIDVDIDPTSFLADDTTAEVSIDEELLVEEVSIDGMCGVY